MRSISQSACYFVSFRQQWKVEAEDAARKGEWNPEKVSLASTARRTENDSIVSRGQAVLQAIPSSGFSSDSFGIDVRTARKRRVSCGGRERFEKRRAEDERKERKDDAPPSPPASPPSPIALHLRHFNQNPPRTRNAVHLPPLLRRPRRRSSRRARHLAVQAELTKSGKVLLQSGCNGLCGESGGPSDD